MPNQHITVDMDTIKIIAQASAEAAAKTVSKELRDEMRDGFDDLERRMTKRLDTYFGDELPGDHIVQHDRMERMLNLMDRLSETIFSNILKNLVWGLIVMGILGWLAYNKITGAAP